MSICSDPTDTHEKIVSTCVAVLRRTAEQIEEHADRHDERGHDRERRQVAGARVAEAAPEDEDQQEAGERERRDQPDDISHGLLPLSRFAHH